MRAHTKLNIGTKGINQITVQEENDPKTTPSQLATLRVTTINPSDNYEIEVGDEMPALRSDNESEEDSDDETFIPKEDNRTQLTGRKPPTTRNVSSINMGRISRGPLQRLAAARHTLRRDGQLYSLLYELEVAARINFNARLNGDLRWMWDELQGKQSARQNVLDSLREQYRIVASLDLEDEPNQVEGHNQVEANNAMTNDECKSKSFESRMAGARQSYNNRKWMIGMKQAIDDETWSD
jgi:hypothetical protein